MARPKKLTFEIDLRPFALEIARMVLTAQNAPRASVLIARARSKLAKATGPTLCYFPGCKNIAAPRFGMFCAAKHKDLPKKRKEALRAKRKR